MMVTNGHGDGQRRPPGQNGPDASKSIVDDGANHRTISTGRSGAVNTKIEAEWLKRFSWPRTSSDRDGW
jgi:hypothetical protein